jgi:hypothetical protein
VRDHRRRLQPGLGAARSDAHAHPLRRSDPAGGAAAALVRRARAEHHPHRLPAATHAHRALRRHLRRASVSATCTAQSSRAWFETAGP